MEETRLEYFKDRLIQKKLSLTQMVQRSEEYGREKDSATQDVADMAVESYTREFMFGRSSGDRAILQLIAQALDRIEDHSFGVCEHCGEPIQPKRLEAVPWAPYCLHCQGMQEKGLLKD